MNTLCRQHIDQKPIQTPLNDITTLIPRIISIRKIIHNSTRYLIVTIATGNIIHVLESIIQNKEPSICIEFVRKSLKTLQVFPKFSYYSVNKLDSRVQGMFSTLCVQTKPLIFDSIHRSEPLSHLLAINHLQHSHRIRLNSTYVG